MNAPAVDSTHTVPLDLYKVLWEMPITLDVGELANAVLNGAVKLFGPPLGALWLFNEQGSPVLIAAHGLTDIKAELLFASLELESKPPEPLNLFDSSLSGVGGFGKRRLGALLAQPLKSSTGLVGWLVLGRLEAIAFNEAEAHAADLLTLWGGQALANAISHEQKDQHIQELTVLMEIANMLASTPRPDDLLQAIVNCISKRFALSVATVQLLEEPGSGILPLTAAYHEDPVQLRDMLTFLTRNPLRTDRSLTARIFETRRPYLTANIKDDPLVAPELKAVLDIGSCLVLPLEVRGEFIGGMYWFKRGRTKPLTEHLFPLAMQISAQIASAVESARRFGELAAHLSEQDSKLLAAYESIAVQNEGSRGMLAMLGRAVRNDLEKLTALRHDPEAIAVTIKDMLGVLDMMEARLGVGQGEGPVE